MSSELISSSSLDSVSSISSLELVSLGESFQIPLSSVSSCKSSPEPNKSTISGKTPFLDK